MGGPQLRLDASGEYVLDEGHAVYGTAREPTVRKNKVWLAVNVSCVTVTFSDHGHYTILFSQDSEVPEERRWTYTASGLDRKDHCFQRAYGQRGGTRDMETGGFRITLPLHGLPMASLPHARRASRRAVEAILTDHEEGLDNHPWAAKSAMRWDFDNKILKVLEDEQDESHERIMQTMCSSLPDALDPDLRDEVSFSDNALGAPFRPFRDTDIHQATMLCVTQHLGDMRATARGNTDVDTRLRIELLRPLLRRMTRVAMADFGDLSIEGSCAQRAQLAVLMIKDSIVVAHQAISRAIDSMNPRDGAERATAPALRFTLFMEPSSDIADEPERAASLSVANATWSASLNMTWDFFADYEDGSPLGLPWTFERPERVGDLEAVGALGASQG